MAVYIHPGKCCGEVNVPASKSLSHRALLAAFLSDEPSTISNLLICDDVEATLGIMKDLGKNIYKQNNDYIITSGVFNNSDVILNANESGSTLRFIIPILSLFNKSFKITGSKKLLSRPLAIYEEIYKSQGLMFELNENYLQVEGKLSSGTYKIPGNISSQFITGLMYALPLLDGDSKIIITEKFESKSYVDMTIDILNKFDVEVIAVSECEYFIRGNQKYRGTSYTVPGDYSQMAFWAVLATINNDLKINGMQEETLQGDSEIVNILNKYCDNIVYNNNSYYIKKSNIKPMKIDLSMIPDLGPILAVLSASCLSESKIFNCYRLKYKESDRLLAVKEELEKMNIDVRISGDTLLICGSDNVINTKTIDSHNDHRIFMSLAVLGTISENGVRIDDERCINKSYPNFLNDLSNVGIKVDYE